MDITLEKLKNKDEVTLEKLSSLTEPIWNEYRIRAKVIDLLNVKSKEGNDYQLVLVSDQTGCRVLYNCSNTALERNSNYLFRVRANQNKRTSVVTVFVLDALLTHTVESLEGKVSLQKKVSTMVVPQLVLVIDRVNTPMKQEGDFYIEDESKGQDLDLVLKDTNDYKYYYRIWSNDESIERETLEPGTIVTFKNATVSKKQGGQNVSVYRNRFTKIIVDTF